MHIMNGTQVIDFETLDALKECKHVKQPGNGNANSDDILNAFRNKAKSFIHLGRNQNQRYACLDMYDAVVEVDGVDVACVVFNCYAIMGIGSLYVACDTPKAYKKIREVIWA